MFAAAATVFSDPFCARDHVASYKPPFKGKVSKEPSQGTWRSLPLPAKMQRKFLGGLRFQGLKGFRGLRVRG